MKKDKIYLGILGLGTVGGGVVEVLTENAKQINLRAGAEIIFKKALVLNPEEMQEKYPTIKMVASVDEIIDDPEIDIVIELMGGIEPAHTFMSRALQAGKSVVTANKDVVSKFGYELFNLAKEKGVDFLFEASVGGGIPIITPLKECLTANRLTEVMGIVNGTTNYMLTKMAEDGCDYDEVLKEAQAKGYAEANPAADVEGKDAARKVAILASLAFNTNVTVDDVSVEGITKITAADIESAKKLGYTVKLLGIARRVEGKGIDVRVHPTFLENSHPLSSVSGVFNAIFVHGNAIGDAMFYGRGAGGRPTASAVIADVVNAVRGILTDSRGRVYPELFEEKKICPLDETESRYYIRMMMDDQLGVLGAVATELGTAGVSLKSVIQHHTEGRAEVVIITHTVKHSKIRKAIEALEKLPGKASIVNLVRVVKSE